MEKTSQRIARMFNADSRDGSSLLITVKGNVGADVRLSEGTHLAGRVGLSLGNADGIKGRTAGRPEANEANEGLRTEWLFREVSRSNPKMMIWKTVSKKGRERFYPVEITSIRGRLLDCINKMRFRGPVIFHTDLIEASNSWCERTYYAENGGAPRGPLKGHVARLRKVLGMKITYVENGIRVEQPEE